MENKPTPAEAPAPANKVRLEIRIGSLFQVVVGCCFERIIGKQRCMSTATDRYLSTSVESMTLSD